MAQLATAEPMVDTPVLKDQGDSRVLKEHVKEQDSAVDSGQVGHLASANGKALDAEHQRTEVATMLDSKIANTTSEQDMKPRGNNATERLTSLAKSGVENGVNASISSSTEAETVVGTAPTLTESTSGGSRDWPTPSKESNLPALLLRMGPAVPGRETAPAELPASLASSFSPRAHLPSRPPVDTWISPSVDTWIAPDVPLPPIPLARQTRDSYIAPRSPSPPRRSGVGREGRRYERSPVRIHRGEARHCDRDGPGWSEDASRQHLSQKRRRSDAEYRGEPRSSRYDDREHQRRDRNSRSGDELRPRYQDQTDHRDRYHRRGSSTERRDHWEGRAHSEERRERREADHRENRRSREDAESRRDTRNGDGYSRTFDDATCDRSPRKSVRRRLADEHDVKGSEDTDRSMERRLQGQLTARRLSLTVLTPSCTVRDYPTISDNRDVREKHRTHRDERPREEDRNAKDWERSPRGDYREDRHTYAEDRPREAVVSSRSEREHSPRKEYEGGRAHSAASTRNDIAPRDSLDKSPVAVNGNAHLPESKPKMLLTTGSTVHSSTARPSPYARPGTSNARHQRGLAPPSSFRRGGSAITGSNTEPITGPRRGFEIPSPPVVTPAPIKVPKDTLSPPFQGQDYILETYAEFKNMVKPLWIENPKQPMANFLTGGKGGANGLGPRGPAYRIQTGRLGGRNVTRYAA